MVTRNANGEVTGYGGFAYEQLVWLSLRLNFRYIILYSTIVNEPHLSQSTPSRLKFILTARLE